MNRTAHRLLAILVCPVWIALGLPAQEAATPAPDQTQDAIVAGIVADLRAREAAAKTVLLELRTQGRLPGGRGFTTRGVLRVLRGAQGAVQAVQAAFDYTFDAEGHGGRMESVKTKDGVLIFEQNPTIHDVFVRMDSQLVADIEWAGKVLQRSDLPGLGDDRAAAPLGSAMVADLAQRYALRELGKKDKQGQLGVWFGGDRKPGPGLEGEDPDVPLADHVELFFRDGDHALLEAVWLQGGEVVQRVTAERLIVDEPMPLESFKLADRGLRPREARDHPPMWEQIQELLQRATEKASAAVKAGTLPAAEVLPPSQRPK